MDDDSYLLCIFCMSGKGPNRRIIRLRLDAQRNIFACPRCGGGFTYQLIQSLTGYNP